MKKQIRRGAWLTLFLALTIAGVACGPAGQADTRPALEPGIGNSADLDGTAGIQFERATATPEPEALPVSAGEPIAPEVDDTSSVFDASGIQVGFTEDGHPFRGNPQAAVVIEEFSDFQCPFCTRFFAQTLPSLDENQIANGDVLFVFHDFPLSSIHPQALAAANAARCAGEEGAVAYWQMHDLLFTHVESWANSNAQAGFRALAQQIGVDLERFDECQKNESFFDLIQADLDLGRGRGISSTPSFFINDQPLVGAQPLAIFNQAIAFVQEGKQIAEAAPPETQPQAVQPAPLPTPATISIEDYAHIFGDPAAPVTIVEYTDYQCPFCQRHVQETMPQMIELMIATGRVRYALKDFPLDSIHPEARQAAVAARCAGEQEAYWEAHDALFAEQAEWSGQGAYLTEILTSIVTDLGLDAEAFSSCLGSGRYDQVIQANQDEAIALGVRGTPFFFINGFPINGAQPFELFDYAIGLAETGTLAEAYQPQPEPTAPPQPTGPVDVPIEGAYSIGDPAAPIVLVEYTDYQCPYCSRHFEQTMPQIRSSFVDQGLVRYVFKDFPLTSIHPQAAAAAEAARCAGEQDGFVQMHDILFARQQEWSNRSDAAQLYTGYAGEMKLNTTQFSECLSTHKYQDAVMADLDEGVTLGVRGTPAFFINGHFMSGAQPYSVFEQAFNTLLSE